MAEESRHKGEKWYLYGLRLFCCCASKNSRTFVTHPNAPYRTGVTFRSDQNSKEYTSLAVVHVHQSKCLMTLPKPNDLILWDKGYFWKGNNVMMVIPCTDVMGEVWTGGRMECWVHTVSRRHLGKGIAELVAGVKLGGASGRPRQKWLPLAV